MHDLGGPQPGRQPSRERPAKARERLLGDSDRWLEEIDAVLNGDAPGPPGTAADER